MPFLTPSPCGNGWDNYRPAKALSSAKMSIVQGGRMTFDEAKRLELTLFRDLTANSEALRQGNTHG